jgi:hypothetical protein
VIDSSVQQTVIQRIVNVATGDASDSVQMFLPRIQVILNVFSMLQQKKYVIT